MGKLDFSKSSPKALKQLGEIQKKINVFCKAHPKKLTERQHKTLRNLLSQRASALSECLGTKVHSLFD